MGHCLSRYLNRGVLRYRFRPGNSGQDVVSEVAGTAAECIVSSAVDDGLRQRIADAGVLVTPFRDEAFANESAFRCLTGHFRVASLGGYGCGENELNRGCGCSACLCKRNAVLGSQPYRSLSFGTSQHMMLDAITLRNLEVKESIRGGSRGATLLSSLDQTRTPMGSRRLNQQLERPANRYRRDKQEARCRRVSGGHTVLRLGLRGSPAAGTSSGSLPGFAVRERGAPRPHRPR